MMTDEQIVKGCLENNEQIQRELFERFKNKMMGVCLRYTDDADEAQDILQNGFIKVFENIHTFKGTGVLEGWIRKIMVNTALNNYRKKKHERNHLDVDSVDYLLEANTYEFETLAAKDLLGIINTLPTGFRTVFNLYAIEGYSHKEIAAQLGISEGTSKSQYSRAKAHLQKIITVQKVND